MTSSLVGSEMCIRDRGSPKPKGDGKSKRPPSREPSKTVCKFFLSAVSYTHLTLPTICSV
eukprot:9877381-Prorocentrum_lima.AAC.1